MLFTGAVERSFGEIIEQSVGPRDSMSRTLFSLAGFQVIITGRP